MKSDFEVSDQGSIVAITPVSEAAQQWLDDNVQAEGEHCTSPLCHGAG